MDQRIAPLRIGDLEIPCYVLEDGRRVLSLGGMVRSLGMSIGSGGRRQGDRLLQFVSGKNISPFVSRELISRMNGAVQFRAPTGGTAATGGLTDRVWDLSDIVAFMDERAPKPGPRGAYKKRGADA